MGEGAGVLVLEDAEVAEARGAKLLGELLGYGASADAYHITAPDPTGSGAARAITLALDGRRRRSPSELSYVNAHGTSTPLNDRSETEALKLALGDERATSVPVSSTKSAIGHLLGAAGAVEAIATAARAARAAWPRRPSATRSPTRGSTSTTCPARRGRSQNGNGRAIGISNSFGFGGHNAVLCSGCRSDAALSHARTGRAARSAARAARAARAALRRGLAAQRSARRSLPPHRREARAGRRRGGAARARRRAAGLLLRAGRERSRAARWARRTPSTIVRVHASSRARRACRWSASSSRAARACRRALAALGGYGRIFRPERRAVRPRAADLGRHGRVRGRRLPTRPRSPTS